MWIFRNIRKTFLPTKDNVKYLGRVVYLDDMLYMAMSATGCEFTFYGTKASITMAGDSTTTAKKKNINTQARVAIYVNGKRVVDEIISKKKKVLNVFKSKKPQECIIKVVKLSESLNSVTAIKSINVDTEGKINPTSKKDMFIEIIGDSLTCGYGLDAKNPSHNFSTTTEDVTKAYSYKLAEILNADLSLFSFSGYGIFSGHSDKILENPLTEKTVPQYYSKIGFSRGSINKIFPQDIGYDFSREPNIIIINLGTNDASYTTYHEDSKKIFESLYVDFLKTVREKNPNSIIVCALGIMGQDLYSNVENAVRMYTKETGDNNICTYKFDVLDPNDGYTIKGHPTKITHEKSAKKFAEYLKDII